MGKKSNLFIIFFVISLYSFAEEKGIKLIEEYLDNSVTIGRQYVFIIGINTYIEWPNLRNPVYDALKLKDVLTRYYFIDEVIELYDDNATKANIIRTFGELQKKCGVHDSLFIFFSGHGYYDSDITNTGFWIPYDGGMDHVNQSNWIPNPLIRKIISKFESNHILLVSDSCFSGEILDLERGIDEERPGKPTKHWMIEAFKRTSRQVLTSGALEFVPDVSEFSEQMTQVLLKNIETFLDTITIYNEIKKGVNTTVPLYGVLKETNHTEGGSFFFIRKEQGVLPPECGLIILKIDTNATLYLDGRFYKDLSAGEWIIDNLAPGKYILKMVYPDGKSMVKEVFVKEGMKEEVLFMSQPKPSSGSLIIITKIGGRLYINNEFLSEIEEGRSGFSNIETGTHDVFLYYADGQGEKKTIEVKAGEEARITFTYIPPASSRTNYFSLGTGFGLTFPLGIWGDVMDMGYCPGLSFGYTFGFKWGRIGVFISSGTGIGSMRQELEQGYDVYMIPLCIGTAYRTDFHLPFYVFAGIAGGAVVSFFQYREEIDQDKNTIASAPLFLAECGIGIEPVSWLSLSAYFRINRIIYSNIEYLDLSPGVRVEYNFR